MPALALVPEPVGDRYADIVEEDFGELLVALRCAELAGNRARAYAGAGIVDGSDPAAEADETEMKLRTILDSLA